MSYDDDVTITMELDERFDNLFGEDAEENKDLENTMAISLDDSPIKDLKVAVLSLDWEMTDQTMGRFKDELDRLKAMWKDNKTLLLFLRLLGGVGKYVRTRKDKAHPGSIALLHSAYDSLEKVVLFQNIPEEEKVKMLRAELNKFKELKEQIARAKTTVPEEIALPPVEAIEIEEPTQADVTPDTEDDNTIGLEDAPMKDLKAVVLSLDLEATDQITQRFREEISTLRDVWKDDKLLLKFLKLLGGLEKYIRLGKDKAHPDSIALLHSAYDSLEKVVLSKGISEKEKIEIFQTQVRKFNELKELIARERTAVSRDKEEKANEEEYMATEPIMLNPSEKSDETVEEKEPDLRTVASEEKPVAAEMPTSAVFDDAVEEGEIDIQETVQVEDLVTTGMMVHDTSEEGDETIIEEELDIEEVSVEEDFVIDEVAGSETLGGDAGAVEEEVSSAKAKKEKRSWFSRKRKKDKKSEVEEDVQAEDMDIEEVLVEEDFVIDEVAESETLGGDAGAVEEEVSSAKAKKEKRSWFSRKRKKDKKSEVEEDVQAEGMEPLEDRDVSSDIIPPELSGITGQGDIDIKEVAAGGDVGSSVTMASEGSTEHEVVIEEETDLQGLTVEKGRVALEMMTPDLSAEYDGSSEEETTQTHPQGYTPSSLDEREVLSPDVLASSLEDLKNTMKDEFNTMREELRLLREGK